MRNTYFVFIFIFLLIIGCKNDRATEIKPEIVKMPENNLPYRLNEEKIMQRQNGKTISLKFIIEESDTITESDIEDFVKNSLKYYINKHDVNDAKENNQIRLSVYTSLDKANSGMAQWIAHTTFHSKKFERNIEIDETQLASLSEVKKDNWGLSYNERQIIWKEILKNENQARGISKNGKSDLEGEKDYINYLNKKLGEKYSIDLSILDSITNEALKYGWSF